jgi:hypothetical protein
MEFVELFKIVGYDFPFQSLYNHPDVPIRRSKLLEYFLFLSVIFKNELIEINAAI